MVTKKAVIISVLLSVASFLAFWKVSHCDFISYDDPLYITENDHIQNGLGLAALRWAFTTGYAANWHPLTWISHMLDIQLFGLNPHFHHLTNLLFHISSTLLLFYVLRRMTKAFWQSAFVASLFALHPLHVESVAWVTERKDVLSTFFWMLTMVAYCHFTERRNFLRYATVLACFALGLMSKPMLVTLPFVLLLLDYWPLGRFDKKPALEEVPKRSVGSKKHGKRKVELGGKKVAGWKKVETEEPALLKYRRVEIAPLVWEKIPLFVLASVSSAITYVVQHRWGAVGSFEILPFGTRVSNALVSYVIYVEKTIWPHNLAFFYPYWTLWTFWQVAGASAFLIAMTLIATKGVRKFRYLTVGWLWHLGTLVPVIGLVQAGEQGMADRYTYVPLVGLFIMAAWGIPELLRKWRHREEILAVSSILVLLCLFIATSRQVGYWQNNFTLFNHAIAVTADNYGAYYARGNAYAAVGDGRQAILDYDRAIEINPHYAPVYYNRAGVYAAIGDQRRAILDYDRAIALNPESADAYNNRGNAYAAVGDGRRAILDYDRAIALNPELSLAYNNRGNAYKALGDQKQAIIDYNKAVELNPELAMAYNNRGNAYKALGNQKQAIIDYNKAVELNPKLAEAYYNRGNAYEVLGDQAQAAADHDKAIALNPRLASPGTHPTSSAGSDNQ